MARIGQSNGTGRIGREQRLSRRQIVFPAHPTKNSFFGRHNCLPYLSVPSLPTHQTHVKHSLMWFDYRWMASCVDDITAKLRQQETGNARVGIEPNPRFITALDSTSSKWAGAVFHNFFAIAVSNKNPQANPETVGGRRYDVIDCLTEYYCLAEGPCGSARDYPGGGFWS
jgi:hypothetical protein